MLLELLVTQTEPAAKRTSYEPWPIVMRFVTLRDRGLMRTSRLVLKPCVQRLPAPATIAHGPARDRICLPTTLFVFGSMTETVLGL